MWPGMVVSLIDRPWSRVLRAGRGRALLAWDPANERADGSVPSVGRPWGGGGRGREEGGLPGGGREVSGISRDTLSSIIPFGYRDRRIDVSIRVRGIETARVRLIAVNSITSSSGRSGFPVYSGERRNAADFCARNETWANMLPSRPRRGINCRVSMRARALAA